MEGQKLNVYEQFCKCSALEVGHLHHQHQAHRLPLHHQDRAQISSKTVTHAEPTNAMTIAHRVEVRAVVGRRASGVRSRTGMTAMATLLWLLVARVVVVTAIWSSNC